MYIAAPSRLSSGRHGSGAAPGIFPTKMAHVGTIICPSDISPAAPRQRLSKFDSAWITASNRVGGSPYLIAFDLANRRSSATEVSPSLVSNRAFLTLNVRLKVSEVA